MTQAWLVFGGVSYLKTKKAVNMEINLLKTPKRFITEGFIILMFLSRLKSYLYYI